MRAGPLTARQQARLAPPVPRPYILSSALGIRELVQLQRRLSWFRLATESGIHVTGPMEVGEGVIDLDVKPGGAGVHVLRLQLGDQRMLLNLTFELPLTEADLAQGELML